MRPVGRIVDTSAIQRYVTADGFTVSSVLLALEASGFSALTPATCISEAYWTVESDEEAMLDVYRTLPQVEIAGLEPDDASTIGGIARFIGSLGLAHACLLAASMQVPLMTAEPVLARKMLRPNLIWEV